MSDEPVPDPEAAGQPPAPHSSTDPDPPPGVDLARALLAQARDRARVQGQARPVRKRPVREPRRAGAGPDARDPQPFGAGIERLVTERGWQSELAVAGAMGRWADIVGAEIAAHATPESFADGVLRVRTDSTAWATQLRLLAPQLLVALNAELGQGTVTRIEVAGPVAPSWRKGPRSVRGGRGPRDTYG